MALKALKALKDIDIVNERMNSQKSKVDFDIILNIKRADSKRDFGAFRKFFENIFDICSVTPLSYTHYWDCDVIISQCKCN